MLNVSASTSGTRSPNRSRRGLKHTASPRITRKFLNDVEVDSERTALPDNAGGKVQILHSPFADCYDVEVELGRGKFAVVKKCRHKTTDTEYAAKFLRKRRAGKDCRVNIMHEVKMMEMALDHPRLVQLYRLFETQHELILVMEFAAGGELFSYVMAEEGFEEQEVVRLMKQILEALVFLHQNDIVHMDIKPQNILLTAAPPNGNCKLCDFGFSRTITSKDVVRDIIGTPDYVAPEILSYEPLHTSCDMWSVGVLVYVMLTGCSPFGGDNKMETFSNITQLNLEFPADLFSNTSQQAINFIKSLLVREPEDRLTAAECLADEWLCEPTNDVTSGTTLGATSDGISGVASDVVTAVTSDVTSGVASDVPPSVTSDIVAGVISDSPPAIPPHDPPSISSDASSPIPSDVPPPIPSDAPPAIPPYFMPDITYDVPADIMPDSPEDLPLELPPDLPSEAPPQIPPYFMPDITYDVPSDVTPYVMSDIPSDTIPDIPSDTIPDFPSDAIPDIQSDAIPDIPSDAIPDIPSDAIPDIPSDAIPDIPSDAIPDIPSDAIPDIQSDAIPDIQSDAIPDIPSDAIPDIPSDAIPDIPSDAIPDIQSDAIPDIPSDVIPDIPSDAIPDIPSDVIPDIPSDVIPDIPSDEIPDISSEAIPDIPSESVSEISIDFPPAIPTNAPPAIPPYFMPHHIIYDVPADVTPDVPTHHICSVMNDDAVLSSPPSSRNSMYMSADSLQEVGDNKCITIRSAGGLDSSGDELERSNDEHLDEIIGLHLISSNDQLISDVTHTDNNCTCNNDTNNLSYTDSCVTEVGLVNNQEQRVLVCNECEANGLHDASISRHCCSSSQNTHAQQVTREDCNCDTTTSQSYCDCKQCNDRHRVVYHQQQQHRQHQPRTCCDGCSQCSGCNKINSKQLNNSNTHSCACDNAVTSHGYNRARLAQLSLDSIHDIPCVRIQEPTYTVHDVTDLDLMNGNELMMLQNGAKLVVNSNCIDSNCQRCKHHVSCDDLVTNLDVTVTSRGVHMQKDHTYTSEMRLNITESDIYTPALLRQSSATVRECSELEEQEEQEEATCNCNNNNNGGRTLHHGNADKHIQVAHGLWQKSEISYLQTENRDESHSGFTSRDVSSSSDSRNVLGFISSAVESFKSKLPTVRVTDMSSTRSVDQQISADNKCNVT